MFLAEEDAMGLAMADLIALVCMLIVAFDFAELCGELLLRD
jgi:hypothetical protein